MNEVQRLRNVYGKYRSSDLKQGQWSGANPGNQAMLLERTKKLEQILQANNFLPQTYHRILDVGCGNGKVLAGFKRWGVVPGNLYGIDLISAYIDQAKQTYPGINFLHTNAEDLDFKDAFFDLILLFTVFTSILDKTMAQNVAREVKRVLRPSGAIVWYDFRYNNPFNPNVRGMSKKPIAALFPDLEMDLHTITVLPPLARRLGKLTKVVYPVLAHLPPLCTHYLGLLIKR